MKPIEILQKHYLTFINIILIAALVSAAIPNYLYARRKAIKAKVQENLSHINNALSRYGRDHVGVIPLDISTLIKEGYMDAFPINPYTGKQMKNIELESGPQAGEFTYVPLFLDYPGLKHDEVMAYYLYSYGDENCQEMEYFRDFGFKRVIACEASGDCFTCDAPPEDQIFLKGADTPVLLDKWKKPATGPESTDNGE